MKSPIKFSAFAFLAPIAVLATPTYTTVTTIDDFSSEYGLAVNGSDILIQFSGFTGPYSNVSGTPLFGRTAYVQGTSLSTSEYTGVNTDGTGLFSFYTPATVNNSLLKLNYSVQDDLNWLSIASSNYLKLDVSSSNLATNFTWTLKDGANNTATWYQTVAALNSGSPVTYAKKFSDFTTSGSFNWSSVRSLEFSSSTNNGAQTTYTDGFFIASYSGAPVPEPSTYGIGLGVLALAAVAIRRRKAVKA